MSRRPTTIHLDDDLLAALDAVARDRGTNRSAVVRGFVGEALERLRREAAEPARQREIGRLIAEGYTRIPQSEDGLEPW